MISRISSMVIDEEIRRTHLIPENVTLLAVEIKRGPGTCLRRFRLQGIDGEKYGQVYRDSIHWSL